jgi:hypothetical protein
MAFVAQLPVAVAPFDQQVQAWLLSPLLTLLFFVILMKALLELPLSYIGTLLVVLALTLRKGRTIPYPPHTRKQLLGSKPSTRRSLSVAVIEELMQASLFERHVAAGLPRIANLLRARRCRNPSI